MPVSKARFIVERRLPQPTSEMPQNVSLNFGNNLSQTRTSHVCDEFRVPSSQDMSAAKTCGQGCLWRPYVAPYTLILNSLEAGAVPRLCYGNPSRRSLA